MNETGYWREGKREDSRQRAVSKLVIRKLENQKIGQREDFFPLTAYRLPSDDFNGFNDFYAFYDFYDYEPVGRMVPASGGVHPTGT